MTDLFAQLERAEKKLFREDNAKTSQSGDFDKNIFSEDNAKTLPRGVMMRTSLMRTAPCKRMSSLDNIMDEEETLTRVEQQEIEATAGGIRRMDGEERWEPNKEGRAPALKPSTLRPNQEVIETRGKPNGKALTPTHTGPTLTGHLVAPIQEKVTAEKVTTTPISNQSTLTQRSPTSMTMNSAITNLCCMSTAQHIPQDIQT